MSINVSLYKCSIYFVLNVESKPCTIVYDGSCIEFCIYNSINFRKLKKNDFLMVLKEEVIVLINASFLRDCNLQQQE